MSIREIMASKLREARRNSGLTAEEVGFKVGKSGKTIYSWESGKGQPDADMLIKVCRIYDMDVRDFFTEENVTADGDAWVSVPLYGSIAAGTPIEMLAVEDTFVIPRGIEARYPESFLLKVVGESMNRVIPNGAYALINPTKNTVDGKAYAVCVNGFDATIKRVRTLENGVELYPDSTDPTIKPMVFDYADPDVEDVTVIGEVVWYVIPFDYEI